MPPSSNPLHRKRKRLTNKIVILFDIDGTLVRCGGAGGQALCAALSAEFSVAEVEPVELHGRTDLGIVNELLERHGLEPNSENRQRLLNHYFELLPDHLQQKQSLNLACVLPGVVSLLDSVCDHGAVLNGILTGNMPASARIKLEHFSLWDYFEMGIFGDLTHHRPSMAEPAMEAIAEHCGSRVCGDSIVIVGDTPLDAELAKAMGARCLCVLTGGFDQRALLEAGADRVVPDLSETQDILSWILG